MLLLLVLDFEPPLPLGDLVLHPERIVLARRRLLEGPCLPLAEGRAQQPRRRRAEKLAEMRLLGRDVSADVAVWRSYAAMGRR